MDGKQWLSQLATIKNTSRKISIVLKTTPHPLNLSSVDDDFFIDSDGEHLSSLSLLTLIIVYGIVVFSGVFGNSTLLISLCSQSTTRVKNPLLLALCSADLLVTMVSAPLTIVGVLLRQSRTLSFSMANIGCKVVHYMQSFPVAASSLCLLMLSLDRYATVKHPRFTQLRQRQYLPSVLALVAWVGASVLCIPFLLVYKVTVSSTKATTLTTSTTTTLPSVPTTMSTTIPLSHGYQLSPTTTFSPLDDSLISDKKLCISDYGSNESWHIVFIVSYVGFAFIVPCFGIIFNHLGVRRKLCALSLTARAQHGELPLPMPTILRRPTHMILVTGMTPNGLNMPESSHDEYLSPPRGSKRSSNGSETGGVHRLNSNRRFNGSSGSGINPSSNRNGLGGTEDESRNLMETRFRSGPRTPRSMRRSQNQQMRARLPSPPCPPAELPLPQTSTLRSRRRLANILVAAGFIYMLCWLPHVCCLVIREFNINDSCSNTAKEFFMVLGFTHSALSPILHWILNYNSLRQSSCQPFAKLSSAQRFLRSHLRFTGPPAPAPSSTNEAALGPFNPKFIKQRPQIYKPPASSHYLY